MLLSIKTPLSLQFLSAHERKEENVNLKE